MLSPDLYTPIGSVTPEKRVRTVYTVQGSGSSVAVGVTDLGRAFFSCPVFSRVELRLLQRFCKDTDTIRLLQYNKFRSVGMAGSK